MLISSSEQGVGQRKARDCGLDRKVLRESQSVRGSPYQMNLDSGGHMGDTNDARSDKQDRVDDLMLGLSVGIIRLREAERSAEPLPAMRRPSPKLEVVQRCIPVEQTSPEPTSAGSLQKPRLRLVGESPSQTRRRQERNEESRHRFPDVE